MHKRGDIIELNGLMAVVVGVAGEDIQTDGGLVCVPEDHVALWYGKPETKFIFEDGCESQNPILWTVPDEYCRPTLNPIVRH